MTDNEIDVIADTLNEIIERAEDVLVRLGYNIHVELPVLGRKLAYAQWGDGRDWRLVWIEDDKKTLVRNSSRDLRLAAARAFPALYQKISETNRALTDDARKVAEDFDVFVGGLEEQITERDRT